MGTPPETISTAPPTTPARRSRRWLYVVIGVVIAAVLVGSIVWYEYSPGGPLNPYHVKVTEVIWQVDGQPYASEPGFGHLAGKSASLQVVLYCYPSQGVFGEYDSVECGSGSVYILTPGFGLVSTNAPFAWWSGTDPDGTTATVSVTVSLPQGSYNGNLTINLE